MQAPRYSLRLAKEDFKFSAAHFTLFADGRSELLHGHNYRVRVILEGERLDGAGLLVDVARVKVAIRAACDRLDERTLVPGETDRLRLRPGDDGREMEILHDDRRYLLPAREVVVLPLANICMELLAGHLWTEIAPALEGSGVDRMRVEVEETAGQSAAVTQRIDNRQSDRSR